MSDDDIGTSDFVVITGLVITGLLGLASVICLGYFASGPSVGRLVAVLLAAAVTAASGWFTGVYEARISKRIPTTERQILTAKQRRELRRVRSEVVMEKALIEVENERQNIVHRQIEAAHDPDKPPHETRWSPKAEPRPQLPGPYDEDRKYRS